MGARTVSWRLGLTAGSLALCLLVPTERALADRGPYVVGEDNTTDASEAPKAVVHADILLLGDHRYSEQFAVERLASSPTGREVAAVTRASREGPKAWEVGTARQLELPAMPQATTTIAYNFGMTHVAAALRGDPLTQRPEGTIALFDLKTGRAERELTGAEGVRAMAFSPDDRLLVAAIADGVLLWQLDQRRPQPRMLIRFAGGADWVSFSGPEEVRIAAEGGNALLVVSTRDGRVLEEWNSREPAGPVCLSPRGRYVARAQGKVIQIHDLSPEGQAGGQRVDLEGQISSLSWAASGRVLAAGTTDGDVFVFSVRGVGQVEPITSPTRPRSSNSVRARPESSARELSENPGWMERNSQGGSANLESPRNNRKSRDDDQPNYDIRAEARTLIIEQMDGD
ncbi:MAG TPA: hypothetical protein DIU15_18165, partial [Deltaproteobacteria bacterium]|nr:hypothetical protein [Deltaproteobacteria bacterium]